MKRLAFSLGLIFLLGCPVPASFPNRCEGRCSDSLDNLQHALRECRVSPYRARVEGETTPPVDDVCVGQKYADYADAAAKDADAGAATRAYLASLDALQHATAARATKEQLAARDYKGLAMSADARGQHDWARLLRLLARLSEAYVASEDGRRELADLEHAAAAPADLPFEPTVEETSPGSFTSTFVSRRVSYVFANAQEVRPFSDAVTEAAEQSELFSPAAAIVKGFGNGRASASDVQAISSALGKIEDRVLSAERLQRAQAPVARAASPLDGGLSLAAVADAGVAEVSSDCPKGTPKNVCAALGSCRKGDGPGCVDVARYNAINASPTNPVLAEKILTDKCTLGLVATCVELSRWAYAGQLIRRDEKTGAWAEQRACELGDRASCESATERGAAAAIAELKWDRRCKAEDECRKLYVCEAGLPRSCRAYLDSLPPKDAAERAAKYCKEGVQDACAPPR